MSSYRGTAARTDKAKAVAAVVAVHVALAFLILSGLNVGMMRRTVDQLTTININQPPPPPPVQPPPKPAPKPQAMKKPEGAPAKKAEASPVVAPQPRLVAPSPVLASRIAGTGTAATSGAAAAGNGTGAGASGNGVGGGGDFSRFTPARRISKIPDREYRMLAASGLQSGSVGVTIRVNPDGSVTNCRVARSSGDGSIDALMCQLTLRYIRFEPARDPYGRPVAQDVTFFPNWWRP
ncbi:MAG: TonB family protein [Sphingomonas sp.]